MEKVVASVLSSVHGVRILEVVGRRLALWAEVSVSLKVRVVVRWMVIVDP